MPAKPEPSRKTASGCPDYHEDCECRKGLAAGGELCRKCHNFALSILRKQGFYPWKGFYDEERTWRKLQSTYMRIKDNKEGG